LYAVDEEMQNNLITDAKANCDNDGCNNNKTFSHEIFSLLTVSSIPKIVQ
jgi:hypothetical protein